MKNFSYQLTKYAPAAVSGVLLVFSFPFFNFSFLAWIALVPFLFSLWNKDFRSGFFSGFVFGLIYFFGTLYWIYYSINHYGNFSFMTSISIVFLLCCYLSLFPALFSVIFIHLFKKTRIPALLLAPVIWVSLEFARSYLLSGFPWSSIGYSQYAFTHIIQIADITGVYGISFLVLSANGALVDLFLMKRRLHEMPLYPVVYPVLGFSLLVLFIVISLAYGFFRINETRSGTEIKASIIQGNIPQDLKWEPIQQKKITEIYLELSKEALSEPVNLVVWPETAVPFYFGTDDEQTKNVINAQKEWNSYLLFGSITEKNLPHNERGFSNSAVLLNKEGQIIYQYDKMHLVPFGEYVPLRKILFFIDTLVFGIGDYVPGTKYIKASTEIGNFATVICYEIIFPGLVRKFFRDGGDFIVTITNDAWFGNTSGPHQHFSMAVFRAIENRKPVIRAANTGISGFIDSNGVILAHTSLFERTHLTHRIKTDYSDTFYSKYGDFFSYFCIVIFTVLIVNTKLRRY